MARTDPTLIIISCEQDQHIDYITPHLELQHILIDPARMLTGTELSYTIRKGKLQVTYNGVLLDNVVAVWYRKPFNFELGTLPVDSNYQHYAHSALQGHWHILRNLFPDAFWLSDYYQIMRAENKLLQLKNAHDIGFLTPETLMTSSSKAALDFINQHESVIVKSLAKYSINDSDGAPRAFFATKITKDQGSLLAGLHLAPAIFQEAIEADLDIRVTIVGNKVFAASITGSEVDKADSPVRDWKISQYIGEVDMIEHTLPDDISKLCVKHVKAMGLQFGVIDLVLDEEGRYWFLENNPNGQWAFVEDLTRQPIGKTIAELFNLKAKTKRAKSL